MNYENIPDELKKLKQWVCYNTDKLPKNPKTGKNAMSNNSDTWGTFEEAQNAMKKYKFYGIGFMFANGYFGVDLDKCIDDIDFVDEFVDKLKSYNEISMSGKGIHIICKGTLPQGQRRKKNVEMYQEGRYFALTGNIYNENYKTIRDCTEEIKALHKKYLETQKKEIINFDYEPLYLPDNELLDRARNSKSGNLFQMLFTGNWEGLYTSQSEADLAFCNMLAFWTQKDPQQMDRIFRNSGLMRTKWDRKTAGSTYGRNLINKAIADCRQVYNPNIKIENINFSKSNNNSDDTEEKLYEQNDTGNAERLFDMYGNNLKYSYENKIWYYWDGKVWREDLVGQIKKLTDKCIEEMKIEAFKCDDLETQMALLKWANKTANSKPKENMIKELQHIGTIPVLTSELDTQKDFINCNNGIVNLRNGELISHDPNYLCTKITKSDYDNISGKKPVKWLEFLDTVTQGDKELQDYIQKAVGYSLTGSTKEQCIFFLYGLGRNGKSTFLDIISELGGTYASHAQPETIMTKNQLSNNTLSDIARLRGARFVTTVEPNENVKLNEGLVKQLTGGDKVTARFLYGREFEFVPEFKIWLGANHKPVIKGTDDGIWRRIRLIPFTAQIPDYKIDRNLKAKLKAELPQIMKWAVDGAIKWQKEGLKPPKVVEEATKEYRKEMDKLAGFIDEYLIPDNNSKIKANDLYLTYCEWCNENNEFTCSATKFFKDIKSKMIDKIVMSDGTYYIGYRLNTKVIYEKKTERYKRMYSDNWYKDSNEEGEK